jgi:hypothetical protein
MAKFVIISLVMLMVSALGLGLYYLVKTPEQGDSSSNLARALTWRIGLWVVLFSFVLVSMKMGWITPSSSVHPAKFRAEQQQRLDAERTGRS